MNSGGVPGFIQSEIDGGILSFRFDALCCAEPVKPESGQYPTTQTKVLLNSTIDQPKIRSWTNISQTNLMGMI